MWQMQGKVEDILDEIVQVTQVVGHCLDGREHGPERRGNDGGHNFREIVGVDRWNDAW